MSRITVLIASCAFATSALADAPTISCAQAQAQVASNGAAVVHSSRFIFDRFVIDRRFCAVTQVTRAAFIETTDAAFCAVGYRCQEPNLTPFSR